jgi:predicted amidohydrolase YtcJ
LAEVETEQEDLMETIVVPGLLDAASMIMEGLEEMRVQMEKQQARVKELRKKKATDPGDPVSSRCWSEQPADERWQMSSTAKTTPRSRTSTL